MKNHFSVFAGMIFSACMFVAAFANAQSGLPASDSIRLNQLGFYPKAPKTAIILTDRPQKFTIQAVNGKTIFSGTLTPSAKPDLSGRTIYLADFSTLQQAGNYVLNVPDANYSYPFAVNIDIHQKVAAAAIKGFYYQRASIPLLEKYAGKWTRPAGHMGNDVLVHPSAATGQRPAGSIISVPRGWYDAGDYNSYIVNSGITMGTLFSLYEDFPAHMKTVALNIPESNNQLPDVLDECLWNLRWMLAMQDPNDGGVYNKLTNASFDGMIMPDKAVMPRYVVQKGTAATLDFAAVMAQASRILKPFEKQVPGLADSCLKAAVSAWQWALASPKMAYNQDAMNKQFEPKVVTGGYGDGRFDDEFDWAAAELYITTKDEAYLKNLALNNIRLSIPSWSQVRMLAYYSLLRNRGSLTSSLKPVIPVLSDKLTAFADSLSNPATLSAYQTAMGRSARDFNWGSSSNAANQGIALINAYLLTKNKQCLNAALANLDYLLGRNGTSYSLVTGFGHKPIMHPHHRQSVADGVVDPVPGLLSGGPNPSQQDKVPLPTKIPNRALSDNDQAYASNEIAINWNAPFAYLANAIEALKTSAGYTK
ncbi:glycoside hydrolase family 9 protein [Mucilaginibacter calamicampi]|uniref:Glycoside hydrolase family 9 protein n=1 Tax=Mucilaginibacter calamicampi TaxID=1302352 RepID=A0ABW2YSN5_9SPHI